MELKARGVIYPLTAMLGISIGLAIFLIVAFDYPFRGEVSMGPESFQEVLNHISSVESGTAINTGCLSCPQIMESVIERPGPNHHTLITSS